MIAGMQKCPVCGVAIMGEEVLFSTGKPGTLARLYARVCQFANKSNKTGCINGDHERIGEITDQDIYKENF